MNKQLVVGYCRVSSDKQKKMGLSLDAQEDDVQKWMRENEDYDLVKVFKFQESASGEERKHLYYVFKYCLENGIKLILISEVDRWTRNRNMDMEARKYLKENGLSVFFIDARKSIPEFDSDDDETFHNIKVDMADGEKRKITKRVLKGLNQKLKRNEYPGLPPLGYKAIAKTRAGLPSRIVQTEDAPIVKKFLETFSNGNFTVHQSVRLAKDLGLRTKSNGAMSRPQLGKLIKSQFYYGEFVWSHPWIDDGKQKIYENKTASFESLISKKTWERNQAILNDKRKNFRTEKLSFKFNNLMTCGKCGRKIYGVQFDHKIRNQNYKYNPYFLCTKGLYTDENGKEHRCATPSFKEKELEQMLMDEIGLIKFKTSHWKKVRALIFKDDTKNLIDYEVQILRMERTNSEKALNKLYDDYCVEIIDEELFKTRSVKIRDRQKEIKERLAELDEEKEHFDTRIGKSIEVLDAMKNWSEILKNASDEKKNQLLRLLTIKISTIHNKVEMKGKTLEYKGLEFTYSPEVQELFEIGILEASSKMNLPPAAFRYPKVGSLIVEKKGMFAAPLRI